MEVGRAMPWDTLTAEQKKFQPIKMAIHAAMVHRMDTEIGRVVEQLKAMGALDNTLILFLSDNGASAEQFIRGDGHDRNAAARLGQDISQPRPGLVERLEYAVSLAQILGSRRGHHDAAGGSLACRNCRPRRIAHTIRPI